MAITAAVDQCNRDFDNYQKLVNMVKQVQLELVQQQISVFPESKFIQVRKEFFVSTSPLLGSA